LSLENEDGQRNDQDQVHHQCCSQWRGARRTERLQQQGKPEKPDIADRSALPHDRKFSGALCEQHPCQQRRQRKYRQPGHQPRAEE
jgi:hypothetical protein